MSVTITGEGESTLSDKNILSANKCTGNTVADITDGGTDTIKLGGWHKIADPPTGWFASKAAGWTADQFTPGGLEVDFSAQVPADTLAIRCIVWQQTVTSYVYYRKSGDANISNTPNATGEMSHLILTPSETIEQAVLWLSADYKVEFAVTDVLTDLYIAYPIEYYIC